VCVILGGSWCACGWVGSGGRNERQNERHLGKQHATATREVESGGGGRRRGGEGEVESGGGTQEKTATRASVETQIKMKLPERPESPLRGQPKQSSQPNELSQGRGGAERARGSRSEGGAREREKKGGGGSEGCER